MPRLFAALVVGFIPLLVEAAPRPMTERDVLALKRPSDPQMSPDGTHAAFVVSEWSEPDDVFNEDVYLVDIAGGDVVRLTYDAKRDWSPRWSPDGTRLAFLSDRGEKTQVYLMRVGAGEPWSATPHGAAVASFAWSPDGDTLYFVAPDARPASPAPDPKSASTAPIVVMHADEAFARIWRLDLDSAAVAPVTDPDRHVVDVSPDGQSLAFIGRRSPRMADVISQELYVVSAGGGPAHVRGFLASYGTFPHVYAAAGYLTLLPNFRGSSNYGAAFAQAIAGDAGGGEYEDCMSGLDALVERGLADPDRLAIKGWSYGGYISGWAVGHTNRFKAAAYGAGLSNAVSYYGTADIQFSRENLHGGTPYSNRARWIERSPLSYVDAVRTPCLIFHGEKDERVPLGQSLEFYMGLRIHDVPSRLVIYPGQPHGLRVPSYQLDKMTREREWIDRYLATPAAGQASR